MKMVLTFGQFRMPKKEFKTQVKVWNANIRTLKLDQKELYSEGFGKNEAFEDYFQKFELRYSSLTVNEICDILDQEMRE